MLKTMVEKMEKILKGKLDKFKFQEKLAKKPEYILKAKEIWNMIDEDLGISDKVENKLLPKVERFEKIIIAKFPELTKEDVMELRKTIVDEFNSGKEKVLNQMEQLKQMQIFNKNLKVEDEKPKAEVNKFNTNDSSATDEALSENYKIQEEDKSSEENK